MTAKDFAALFPKPWRLVMNETTFTLVDREGATIGLFRPTFRQLGMPYNEFKRHLAAAFSEALPCIEASEATDRRRGKVEQRGLLRQPKVAAPDAENLQSVGEQHEREDHADDLMRRPGDELSDQPPDEPKDEARDAKRD